MDLLFIGFVGVSSAIGISIDIYNRCKFSQFIDTGGDKTHCVFEGAITTDNSLSSAFIDNYKKGTFIISELETTDSNYNGIDKFFLSQPQLTTYEPDNSNLNQYKQIYRDIDRQVTNGQQNSSLYVRIRNEWGKSSENKLTRYISPRIFSKTNGMRVQLHFFDNSTIFWDRQETQFVNNITMMEKSVRNNEYKTVFGRKVDSCNCSVQAIGTKSDVIKHIKHQYFYISDFNTIIYGIGCGVASYAFATYMNNNNNRHR